MIPLPWLSADEFREYETTLATGYEMRTTVRILTNEDEPVSTVSAWILDGQVNARVPDYDRESERIEVSRDASLTLLDPDRELGFDSRSPVEGAMYLDRMIAIDYGVRCSFGWVDVPVFTGPLTSFERDGEIVSIEAQGKELFGLSEANTTRTYKKGAAKNAVLRHLIEATGEDMSLVDLPPDKSPLVKTFSISHESHRWFQIYRVARSLGREAYYDGSGHLRMPKLATSPVWKFAHERQGMILSPPTIGVSVDGLKNAARVVGGAPKGSKTKSVGTAQAPATSILAAAKIGRRGVPRYLLDTEEDSSLNTKAKATARAKELLADGLAQEVSTKFTALPVPHLEPVDVVVVSTPQFAIESRINNLSLPLTANGSMSIGFHDRVARPMIPIARRAV